MTKQIIAIGAQANDGTGTPLRDAMNMVNDNFDELYSVAENAQTAGYVLTMEDNLKLVSISTDGASNLTVPPDSSVAFPIGAMVLIEQEGAGQVSVVAGAGVTIHSADSALKLIGQYSTATLIKKAADTWLLAGAITV